MLIVDFGEFETKKLLNQQFARPPYVPPLISTPELCLNERMNELMKERSNLIQRFIYAR